MMQGFEAGVTTHFILQQVRQTKPLPIAVQKLYSMVDDIQADIRDVERTISSDEVLSAKLLQLANSAFYGFSHRISSIPQAVAVIGFQGIRSMALSVSVGQFCERASHMYGRDDFWKRTLKVATAARMMGTHLPVKSPDNAFAVGILHDIGQILLLQAFPQAYQQLLQISMSTTHSIISLESKTFQITHPQVSLLLCQHWKLPVVMHRAIAEHHRPVKATPCPKEEEHILSYILQRANNLVDLLDNPPHKKPLLSMKELVTPWGNMAMLNDMIERIPQEVAQIESFLKSV